MMKFFAPGRVNLIGEHLDYNGGLVLPMAIEMGITLSMELQSGDEVKMKSDHHPLKKTFHLQDEIEYDTANGWMNYPLGVIRQLRQEGFEVPSCSLSYSSDLPEGSGLSSSAAIEIVTAFALLHATNSDLDLKWLANFCKSVENDFIGVQCGIMDQYAIALGQKDNALLLDCAALSHEYVPFELGPYWLVIMDTKKPRSLIHSKYNERKEECNQALDILRGAQNDLPYLCAADMVQLELISDHTIRRRARHVISENLRVKEAKKVLQLNDLRTFGRLMHASHHSLQHDYEVSGTELDIMVEAAQSEKCCLGARMTGAGFGGCAIAIVHEQAYNEFVDVVSKTYTAKTGIECAMYKTNAGNGVRKTE